MNIAEQVAEALLKLNAVGFSVDKPITFKSGMLSPVYTDNRKLPFYPDEWKIVINGFGTQIQEENIEFDIIAGVEAGGIPHSAALGFSLSRPSVFIRKELKGYGTNKRVEGGVVQGKRVVLIEDLVTTGSSSLSAVTALRNEGGIVDNCLVIVSYGFTEAIQAFKEAGVALHTLTSFPVILDIATKLNKCTAEQRTVVESWLKDPWAWTNTHSN